MNDKESYHYPGELRSYAGTKLFLADTLRVIRRELLVLERDESEKACFDLMTKLAGDHFTLAVLGQFKRGKSSLMNAIVGSNILPTGVLPLTSVITVLKYGPEQRLVIHKKKSGFDDERPVSAIMEYVTENGNPSNIKNIDFVDIEMPEPFLRYGLEFVDTPGVGSIIEANTETTYNFLPECDAVLFVTGADTPMTENELALLKNIKKYTNKIFFIINKIDLVTEAERTDIEDFVTGIVSEIVEHEALKIFSVSSKWAINARQSGNEKLLQKSGIENLKLELDSFLANSKADIFLAAIAKKALRIINDEEARGIFSESSLFDREVAIKREKTLSVNRDPRTASASLQEQRKILEQFLRENKLSSPGEVPKNAVVDHAFIVEQSISNNPIDKKDIDEHLQQRSCPVCSYLAEKTFRFFAQWQYLVISDIGVQNAFASELGFCPLHTWQLLAMCSPYGASVGFAKLSAQIAEQLKIIHALHKSGRDVVKLIHNAGNCKVCEMLKEAEGSYIDELINSLKAKQESDLYTHSQGLCLKHLAAFFDKTDDKGLKDLLLSAAISLFEKDAEDMRSFALKFDALRRWEQNKNEKDAYRRMVARLVGDKRIVVPWEEDGEIG